MTFEDFYFKWNGKPLEFNHDGIENQCMDLFYQYLQDVIGIDPKPFQGWGSAKNCYNNFDNIKGASKIFTKIKNDPNNVPKRGDVVFWGTYPGVTGFAGHVGIFYQGDLYTVWSFDQNYPTGSPCAFVKHGTNKVFHGYRGVMGWLHKK